MKTADRILFEFIRLFSISENLIYKTPVETLEDLQERLCYAIANITPEMLQRV